MARLDDKVALITGRRERDRVALPLASDDCARMTSHTFAIDGGLSG